jgi:hypothetical protein
MDGIFSKCYGAIFTKDRMTFTSDGIDFTCDGTVSFTEDATISGDAL